MQIAARRVGGAVFVPQHEMVARFFEGHVASASATRNALLY
jgi:hypothetical protein